MKVLEAKGITKIFPGVIALDGVDISFEMGEIHCVIGENGAGKSTLIKCLTGVYEPEEGEIYIDGQDAIKNRELFNKVAYVPQEIDLFPYMSVAENLFLPYDKSGFNGAVDNKKIEKAAEPLLKRFHINVKPSDLVKDISVSEQQLLQIARATVHTEYEVLMLDEPTTSLTMNDTKVLFEVIKEIKKENKAIIFISHKLEEIFELGDVLTVFVNGKKVAYSPLKEIDIPWVITKMTGHAIDQNQVFYPDNISDEVLLETEHLTGERFTDISFKLRRGEILGFTGLVGAGRSELMQAIFGYLPIYSGNVKIDGKEWKKGDTNYSVNQGVFYLPEERKTQGILPVMSVRENICISSLDKMKNKSGISLKIEQDTAHKIIDEYNIKCPTMEREIKFLSGGNQQKVIIGRTMCCDPKILIFDEPTKGIDVATKAEIYKVMKYLAEKKRIGIILISSEMEEIMKCSNRIIAMYNGKMAGEYDSSADKQVILSSIIGVKQ